MSFFGIGKKKLDEQSREEQSAETAKVQKEQVSEDAPKNARLSQKIMEQQQWEDSLRRFVKSEAHASRTTMKSRMRSTALLRISSVPFCTAREG